ncbi:hypothetical protein NE865_08655 [Phthorimaea operculella]|nr:hypothetical protein NE865_08655 [Phthorimaea operculella]
MAYFGKEFKTVSQENFDGFVNALGANIPEDIKKALAAHKPTFKVSKNGDQYTFTSGNFNGTHEVSFTPGVEYSETVYGSPAKSVTTVDGDVFTTVQNFEAGSITQKREFSADQLVLSITSNKWDGAAKRVYKA